MASSQQENTKTPEQIHYENLSSFLKWGIGIAGTIIAAIASIAIYVSYSDRNSMRDEYSNTIKDLRTQIVDIKNDASQTGKDVKENLRNEVLATKQYSDNELAKIQAKTSVLAIDETKKQIESIFATDKIQNIIQNQAVKEIKNKVSDIVNNETKNLSKINDAASEMRVGRIQGMDKLMYYFQHSGNYNDSTLAKNLYDQILQDYRDINLQYRDSSSKIDYYYPDSSNRALLSQIKPIHIINNRFPTDPSEKNELLFLINNVNDKNNDLNLLSYYIGWLSRVTNLNFIPFQLKEINDWFNKLIR